ncbi:MAG: hypothetical protein E7628_03520 [Ruminococcaceae bacterium]|nr:hypothetical protein [Oscillospiraceae bacterium]
MILILALTLVGCGGKKPIETEVPETNLPEADGFETDVPETDLPETEVPETDFPVGDVYDSGEVDVRITFDPTGLIPDNDWVYYAAEAVSEIAAKYRDMGYDVSIADIHGMRILHEGCGGGLSDLVYTFTVDFVIYVWGEDVDPATGEADAWDGAVLDELGRLFLHVAEFEVNGRQYEEYSYSRESHINVEYGEDDPDRFKKAALSEMDAMKDKYADGDIEFDEVMSNALNGTYPTETGEDYIKCSAWSYTVEETLDVSTVVTANVVICTAEYRMTDSGIECESEEYTYMYRVYSKTPRGYELITSASYGYTEIEKDPALIEECFEAAKTHFMQSDTTKVPEAYLHIARETNVNLGFDPSENHHTAGFVGYAKEYVWQRIANALYSGYNVSSAELLGMDVVSTGVAGLMEGVWTLDLSYNINVWGEETDEVTGETVTFDGIISDETEGKAYLMVANYRKNAGDVVMHKFITEAEINVLYGENNPDKYTRAASQYMRESKDAYIPDREYTLEQVVYLEMADMYPTVAEWDYLKCYAYTMTASEVDEYGDLSVEVIAYEGEYSLVDGKIVENGGRYLEISLPFRVDETGYTTITRSGGRVDEDEKDPALIEECRKKAEAHFANHMNSGTTQDDLFAQFYNSKYTPEQWIEYNLYSDFGFREPVDVTALSDDELREYMNDAYCSTRRIRTL